MAVPKRRNSKTRGRKRRTHWKQKMPQLIRCPNCHQLIPPHTVCSKCHYYMGKERTL
ncbi:MAG: 50S ribosomal protein L32 [bacterium (Candidatus Stahlbacteria) CG08_land_8_20_14_0_20_40_26]|nr:MAG: 50S ribosomal protein L32 [bacterium (Candidatus Stahlbacteria) CG23_combo_of_CG06-09_8_20_14_all_40_9]PIS25083.1 MAG: 50S ribosomal protein L32 [bacterium (Candidatus Stahlbacteria) CG08_land_8_20_14_0_20_40_26]